MNGERIDAFIPVVYLESHLCGIGLPFCLFGTVDYLAFFRITTGRLCADRCRCSQTAVAVCAMNLKRVC